MRKILVLLAFMAVTAALLTYTGHASHGDGGDSGHVSVARFLFEVVIILLAAKVGGELFETWNQPAVLGELVFGVVLGNLSLFGMTALEVLSNEPGLAFAAEIGVILLLFEVGLESDLGELLEVGTSALIVAVLGVTAPIILGYGVSYLFPPGCRLVRAPVRRSHPGGDKRRHHGARPQRHWEDGHQGGPHHPRRSGRR